MSGLFLSLLLLIILSLDYQSLSCFLTLVLFYYILYFVDLKILELSNDVYLLPKLTHPFLHEAYTVSELRTCLCAVFVSPVYLWV